MNTDKVLRIVGIAALAFFALQWVAGKVYEKFIIGSIGLTKKKLTPYGLELRIVMPITNKTPVNLPIDGFQGSLLYGSARLANVSIITPLVISGGATTDIVIETQIKYEDISASIIDLINTGEYLRNLRVKGNLFSSGIIFPVDRTISIL